MEKRDNLYFIASFNFPQYFLFCVCVWISGVGADNNKYKFLYKTTTDKKK